jgi:hypothetical protein
MDGSARQRRYPVSTLAVPPQRVPVLFILDARPERDQALIVQQRGSASPQRAPCLGGLHPDSGHRDHFFELRNADSVLREPARCQIRVHLIVHELEPAGRAAEPRDPSTLSERKQHRADDVGPFLFQSIA